MLKNEFWETIPYFKKNEFDCKCGCGFNIIDKQLVLNLNRAREISNTPFVINSACRCALHNSLERGSDNSSHKKGLAVDIKVNNSIDRFNILDALLACGISRIGIYKNFIHCDVDDSKSQNVIWYK